jgi:hypothetical protein
MVTYQPPSHYQPPKKFSGWWWWLIIPGILLLIGGCSIFWGVVINNVLVEPTPTATYTPSPRTQTTEDEDKQDIAILEISWDSFNKEEQNMICDGFIHDPGTFLDAYFAELDGNDYQPRRAVVYKFFEGKCT